MKRIFISALALLGIGTVANAQEKVTIHNGSESYVTNVEYITFDATEADEAVSVSALQTEITSLTSEKTTLEGQISTLTSEKAELEAEIENIKDQIEKTGTIGHDYVDLGLPSGTLWATCNVGARAPYRCGDFFAWGETMTHYNEGGGDIANPTWKDGYSEGYEWSTYFDTKDNGQTFIKYNVGGKTELDDADDVAVKTWGGKWQMPTYENLEELKNECYWVFTSKYNGKTAYGAIVFKAKNDADKGKITTFRKTYDEAKDIHIFICAGGMREDTNGYWISYSGVLLSRTLSSKSSDKACCLHFHESSVMLQNRERFWGFNIRPVIVVKK